MKFTCTLSIDDDTSFSIFAIQPKSVSQFIIYKDQITRGLDVQESLTGSFNILSKVVDKPLDSSPITKSESFTDSFNILSKVVDKPLDSSSIKSESFTDSFNILSKAVDKPLDSISNSQKLSSSPLLKKSESFSPNSPRKHVTLQDDSPRLKKSDSTASDSPSRKHVTLPAESIDDQSRSRKQLDDENLKKRVSFSDLTKLEGNLDELKRARTPPPPRDDDGVPIFVDELDMKILESEITTTDAAVRGILSELRQMEKRITDNYKSSIDIAIKKHFEAHVPSRNIGLDVIDAEGIATEVVLNITSNPQVIDAVSNSLTNSMKPVVEGIFKDSFRNVFMPGYF